MPQSDAAVERYRAALRTQRRRTSAVLVKIWDALDSPTDDPAPARFAERATPVLAGVKRAAVITSAAFYATYLDIGPVAINPDEVDVEPRLRDPFTAAWHALNMGRPYDEVIAVGRSTVEEVGSDFVVAVARVTQDTIVAKAGLE